MSDVPSDTTAWARLDQALTRLHAAGHQLTLWWRDDDAVRATPQLDRLLDLAQRYHLPLALAVVPGPAETSLVERLDYLSAQQPEAVILQHGWTHQNHAAAGEKKCEYPASRDPDICLAELSQGQARLRHMFRSRFLPVLVPPWNRFAPTLIPSLAHHGFIGLSGGPSGFSTASSDGKRSNGIGATSLRQAHTTLDPIDWASRRNPASNSGTGLRPVSAILDDIITPLEDALAPPMTAPPFPHTTTPPDFPAIPFPLTLGILTHHLVHDAALWAFLDQLFLQLTRHPAVRFISAHRLFQKN